MKQTFFYTFILLYMSALLYLASTLPIGPNEATVYYTDQDILYTLTHFANGWFGNGLDFRLPFVFFAFVNSILFFIMTRLYFTDIETSYLATAVFLLLPGIITSAILVNIAVVVMTLVLAFITFYEKKMLLLQAITMLLLLLIHGASIIFFVSVGIFALMERNRKLFILSSILGIVSLFYFNFNGLEIGGKPQGEFMELFSLYVGLFSPLVFLYFFYALYRIWLREKKDILWYISFSSFIFSIILSLRQQVIMTDFAPYVIVSVVLMIVIYHQTLHVRLPQFQIWYRRGFYMVLSTLVMSAMVIFFHKSFFYILEDKSKHFAYRFYEPYWKVIELHEIEKNCYTVPSRKEQYQLKYHGIVSCEDLTVSNIHK